MQNDLISISLEIPESIQSKWQNIIDIMARIINVPAGLIMRIVDTEITVFISSKTENNPYVTGTKEHLKGSGLYCETVLKTNSNGIKYPIIEYIPRFSGETYSESFSVEWEKHPDIKLNMISYLGFPITLPDKTQFGTICVLDDKENSYSELYIHLLQNFRSIIETDLELLYANQLLGEKNRQLSDYIAEIQTLRKILPICANCKNIRDDKGYWNQLEEYFKKGERDDLPDKGRIHRAFKGLQKDRDVQGDRGRPGHAHLSPGK